MLSTITKSLIANQFACQKNFVKCSVNLIQNRNYDRWVFGSGNYKTHFRFNKMRNNKHKDPKWKRERADKVLKIDLPDFQEKFQDLSPQEARMRMKRLGLEPIRPWMERPVHISSTGGTFEPYIPPEGDGKVSIVSKEGAKQKLEFMGKKSKSYMAMRKIRQFDEDFHLKDFVQEAQDIYIKAHKALADGDEDLLHELVTERAFPLMTHETKNKTIRWQFIESIEPPRAVHIRNSDMISKENIFSQITVRMHTKQTLAVYDRFGRLMNGSEVVAKDVLEYVVFENHVASSYGTWRVHDKIIPTWAPSAPPIKKTYRIPPSVEEELEETTQTPETADPNFTPEAVKASNVSVVH